jgi:hypothetical protein
MFRVRFNEAEMDEIKAHCEDVGVSFSWFVRKAVTLLYKKVKESKGG